MALGPGDHLARFAIQAIVGEGGMGRVYRAYDEHLHRHVALKVVRTDDATDEEASREAAARLLQEARVKAWADELECDLVQEMSNG